MAGITMIDSSRRYRGSTVVGIPPTTIGPAPPPGECSHPPCNPLVDPGEGSPPTTMPPPVTVGTDNPPGVVGGIPPTSYPLNLTAPASQLSSSTSSPIGVALSNAIANLIGQLSGYAGIAILVVVGYLLYRWWRKGKR